MSLILNIDTSTEIASVSIAREGEITCFLSNNIQKEHASFLHPAIKNVLQQAVIKGEDLDAIAVTEGPGSYTGLRIGMAAAKGLSYALNKPFITIGTLNAMASAAANLTNISADYYCPMIDARRMEVYTALFNNKLIEILPACAVILTENLFMAELKNNKIVFLGSGIKKWKALISNSNCSFIEEVSITASIAQLSHKKFRAKEFTELAHSQPLYVKEFFNGN
ncbi:MAG: tRNA (adenosine(37)-N6)-threonylcarbamoyltransferase complex dimerization subunit type 1 TsaB [Ferruginibacter sp.]